MKKEIFLGFVFGLFAISLWYGVSNQSDNNGITGLIVYDTKSITIPENGNYKFIINNNEYTLFVRSISADRKFVGITVASKDEEIRHYATLSTSIQIRYDQDTLQEGYTRPNSKTLVNLGKDGEVSVELVLVKNRKADLIVKKIK